MHLKNWSLITREDKVELSPAYDLINSTIPHPRNGEELALTLRGRKSHLAADDFWRYFASERLELSTSQIEQAHALRRGLPTVAGSDPSEFSLAGNAGPLSHAAG